jgi:fibronectin type 3 domain-containing protein/regulation of enolase protein 1 (concanavalin A-like superfamily)
MNKNLLLGFSFIILVAVLLNACSEAANEASEKEQTNLVIPQNVRVTPLESSVRIEWDQIPDVRAYNIYMASEPGVNKYNYNTLPGGMKHEKATSPFTHDASLTDGTTYYFVLTAVYTKGESPESEQVAGTPGQAILTVPQNLTVTALDSNVQLQWNPVDGATGYAVYMANESGVTKDNFDTLAGGMQHFVNDTFFTHPTPLVNGTTYYFVVTALNEMGNESAVSEQVSATPKRSIPKVPQNVAITPLDSNIELTWDAVDGAGQYNIYMASESGVNKTNYDKLTFGMKHTVTANSFTHPTPLVNGTPYFFVITALNDAGESAESEQVTATPIAAIAIPAQPQNVVGISLDASAHISWDAVTGATEYNVYMTAEAGVTPVNYSSLSDGAKFTTTATTFEHDPTLNNGQPYYFIVTATNLTGESIASQEIPVTPWARADIGNTGLYSFDETNGVVTMEGAGIDIWGTTDEFYYAYAQLAGDGEIIARVTGQSNTSPWAKAGVMVRESIDPDSRHVFVMATPEHGVRFQRRANTTDITGDETTRINNEPAPRWIRLIRRADTFEAYESADGVNWRFIGTQVVPMNQDALVGLAVTSHSSGVLSRATFENVTINHQVPVPPSPQDVSGALPFAGAVDNKDSYYYLTGLDGAAVYNINLTGLTDDADVIVYEDAFNTVKCGSYRSGILAEACLATPNSTGELFIRVNGSYSVAGANFTIGVSQWTGQDIGTVAAAGSDSGSDGSFSISGSGVDIYGTADGFHFVYQPIAGDVEIIARVASQDNTDDWAKAGVMIRETLATDAVFVDAVVTPVNGVRFQSRNAIGGSVVHDNTRVNTAVAPRWVRLVRRGDSFDVYESTNGAKWLYIGSTQVYMDQNAYVGLAVTSHNDGVLSTATFDNVRVYYDAGNPLVINDITPASFPLVDSVDTMDKFYSVSGLAVNTAYTVVLDNLSDNADLHVYTDALFGTPVCPVPGVTPTIPDGTTAESCVVTATATGQIFIRVNGSYSTAGATFTLDAQ